jgi:hypothetical protein
MQMTRLSFRQHGTPLSELVKYPFHPVNFLNFIDPYLWGDPRKGTYPTFSDNWGIFWENTGYVGVLSLFLAVIALFKPTSRHKQAILAAIGFSKIKSPILQLLVATIILIDIGHFALGYHSVIDAQKWLEPPPTAQIIKSDKSWYRIYTAVPINQWNDYFIGQGWKNMKPFEHFRNALDANQNLFWNLNNTATYAGLNTKRYELFISLTEKGIVHNDLTSEFTISSASGKLLSLAGVKYLTSPNLLTSAPESFTSLALCPTSCLFNQQLCSCQFYSQSTDKPRRYAQQRCHSRRSG